MKQTQIDEIKWFICFKKFIWWTLSPSQIWPTIKNNPSCLLHYLLYMDVIFIMTFYFIILVPLASLKFIYYI
jgi:hypothetical protein